MESKTACSTTIPSTSTADPMARHLTNAKLFDPTTMQHIYENMAYEAYISREYSPYFFIEMVRNGFTVSTLMGREGEECLMPIMPKEAILLEHKHLHISKKVRKLMAKSNYSLSINTHFEEILERILEVYKEDCFMHPSYIRLLRKLETIKYKEFRFISCALIDHQDGNVVAGELGYIIRNRYVGISKFSMKDKGHTNLGTLQRVLLTKYLSKTKRIYLSDLGRTFLEYKMALGAKSYDRQAYLAKCVYC